MLLRHLRPALFGVLVSTLAISSVVPVATQAQAAGQCNLPQPASCDTFDAPVSTSPATSRGGPLDPAKWSISRLTGFTATPWTVNAFLPSNAMHCKTPITGVLPDNDYFECGPESGESNHFMEAFDAAGTFVYNDARSLQPFDFANRTGTFTFDVDAKNSGDHGWWLEIWVTDESVPAPRANTRARNAVGFDISGTCGTQLASAADGSTKAEPVNLWVIKNYAVTQAIPWMTNGLGFKQSGYCPTTMPDMKNHFKVTLNQNTMQVFATDMDPDSNRVPLASDYHLVDTFDNLGLTFTRGFIHYEHLAYNPEKAGATSFSTYHWDNIGFDGPVIPAPAHYQVPDSLKAGGGNMNTGYLICVTCDPTIYGWPKPVIKNVNLAGATKATLTFNHGGYDQSVRWRFNDGPWHQYDTPNPTIDTTVNDVAVDVPLNEIQQGDNTLEFRAVNHDDQQMVANIDLLLDHGAAPATSTPVSTPVSTSTSIPTQVPTRTPVPTSTVAPCRARVSINGNADGYVNQPNSFCGLP